MKIEDTGLCYDELSHLVDQWIFDERDRKIIKRRLLDGIHFEPLAEEFDLSTQQVKNIVAKGKNRLFKHIKI